MKFHKYYWFVFVDQLTRLLTTTPTIETIRSSDHLIVDELFEYFDKRFRIVAHNMEQLMSDVAALRNQIDELIPDVICLKQHIHDTGKTNKKEYDDNASL